MEKFFSDIQKHILIVRKGKMMGKELSDKIKDLSSVTDKMRKNLLNDLETKFGIRIEAMTTVTFDKNGKVKTERIIDFKE